MKMISATSSFKKRDTIILCGILLIKIIAQFLIINPVYQLQRDEYLHLDQGNHLAWGYVSVPPFTSWTSWIIIHLGHTDFWIRFFPAFWGAGTIAAAWHITKAAGGNFFAKMLTGIALLFSVLLRMNTLYQPNTFEIFDWTLMFLFLVKFIFSEDNKWLYWLAITIAIGFLNKYNIAFICAGIFAGLLLTPQRKIFTNKHFYFAAAIMLTIILPNIFWQFYNHFPVIGHMKELEATQLVNNSATDFLMQQLLAFSGPAFIIIAALAAFIFYKPFVPLRFMGIAYVVAILLYLYFHAKGYYLFGVYPAFVALGSCYLEALSYPKRKFIRPVSFVLVLLLFIPMRLALPVYSPEKIRENKKKYEMLGMLKWEDGKQHDLPQDFADMLGWKELAAKTAKLFNSLPDKNNTIIICDNYGQAGAINYYAGLKANSFNADYLNWFDTSISIKNMIRITYKDHRSSVNEYKGQQLFDTMVAADSITDPDALEGGGKIWLLKNNRTDINKIIAAIIEEKKKE